MEKITKAQYLLAKEVGRGRHEQNTLRREASGDKRARLSLETDQIGALGEICFANYIGENPTYNDLVLPWQEFNTKKHEIADVGDEWEVKTITDPRYNLVCEANGLYDSKLNRKYVLIYLDLSNKMYEVKGYIMGHQFKNPAIAALKPARSASQPAHYLVYTKHLTPLKKENI